MSLTERTLKLDGLNRQYPYINQAFQTFTMYQPYSGTSYFKVPELRQDTPLARVDNQDTIMHSDYIETGDRQHLK